MTDTSTSNSTPCTPFVKSQAAQLLSEHGVMLVHCSGDVKGFGTSENKLLMPIERLVNEASDRPDVSCSTVKKGDFINEIDPLSKNYYGPLGLILDPVSLDRISLSYPNDAGSTTCPVEKIRNGGKGLGCNSAQDISDAILKRGTVVEAGFPPTGWNEICCSNFEIVGLFADRQNMKFMLEQPPYSICHVLADVGLALPHLPLYFFGGQNRDTLIKLAWDSSKQAYNHVRTIAITDIYDETQRL